MLMRTCWEWQENDRPSFADLVSALESSNSKASEGKPVLPSVVLGTLTSQHHFVGTHEGPEPVSTVLEDSAV
jgi:hypothetical protein